MNSFTRHIVPQEAFKYLLVLFIIFTSIIFYSVFIPFGGSRYVVFMGALVIMFFLFVNMIYDRSKSFPMQFKLEAWFMLLPLFFSFFAAKFFHDQPFYITLIGQHGVYFILLYFLLHKLKPSPDVMMKMFIWLGYGYCIVYAFQFLIYPVQIVHSNILVDRGTIRIFMPGSEYIFTGYFILTGRFFMTRNPKHLLLVIPYLIILLLMGTRQMIGSLVFASMINILLSRTIKSKLLMYILIAACLIPFYFIFQNIFDEMFKISHQQTSEGITQNVRYKAVLFYLFKYNTNYLWMFFGNGMPDVLSRYGRELSGIGQYGGLYLEDIGLFGDFFRFGILFVIAKLSMYIRLLKWKLLEKYTFIRYNVITILLTLFTGGGTNASVLTLTCLMMYFADVNNQEMQEKEEKNSSGAQEIT